MLILVSASLLTKTVRTYAKEKSGVCKGLKAGTSDARCAQLTVGVVSIRVEFTELQLVWNDNSGLFGRNFEENLRTKM